MTARPVEPGLTVCVIAAETSGDRLGAALMRALKATRQPMRFVGMGSGDMLQEGLQPLAPIQHHAFIGLSLVTHLPAIYRYIRDVSNAAVAARPDVLVIIDSPDLTHRIARRVRKYAPSIPIVDYVSPSVWAWRPGRARAMRAYVDHVLALLPFEPEVHRTLAGPPCTYVGHPLIERIDSLRPNAEELKRRRTDPPVLLILPGSRAGEIRRLLDIFKQTVSLMQSRHGPFDLVLPTLPGLVERIRQQTVTWPVQPLIVVDSADKHAAFRLARAALAKSGTVTLELALAGIPMVAAYRVPPMEAAIFRRLALIDTVILANLVLQENVVPEFLQQACNPQNLAAALAPLLEDTPERRRQIDAFARLDAIMGIAGAAPSAKAAEIVLGFAGGAQRRRESGM